MTKSTMGIGRRSLIGVMAALGLFSTAGNSTYIPGNSSQTVRVKDATNNMPSAPKPQNVKNNFQGGGQSIQVLSEIPQESKAI